LLLALREEAVALIQGGFALVEGTEDLGLLLFGKLLLVLLFGIGFGRGLAAAARDERGARECHGEGEEFHTHRWDARRGGLIQKNIARVGISLLGIECKDGDRRPYRSQ
jgi:hypothetical protein